MLQMNRDMQRNHLPIISNPPTQFEHDRESYLKAFPYYSMAFCAFAIFSMRQFSKAYFPLGIILRNSIPQTMQQKVM